MALMSQMEVDAVTELEHDVICEDADTFVMSCDRLEALNDLLCDVS
jgi:hypothetical protein